MPGKDFKCTRQLTRVQLHKLSCDSHESVGLERGEVEENSD